MLNRIFPQIPRFGCPDEHQLAAYVDQQLIGAERQRVETHVARCNSCLQQVGFLTKHSQDVGMPVPAGLLHRAENLQAAGHGNARLAWKWAPVVVVITVLAIGLAVRRGTSSHEETLASTVARTEQPAVSGVRDNRGAANETAVRSALPGRSEPLVLSPQPDATVHASHFIIRWKPISNATSYEVRLVTADGSLVWLKRVRGDSVIPPHRILRTGVKYFVWVRALLPDGTTEQSVAVGFIGG